MEMHPQESDLPTVTRISDRTTAYDNLLMVEYLKFLFYIGI